MRLRTVVPPLPEDLLDALEEIGLRTDADLMFFGTPMELYQKLPVGTITLAALTKHIEAVIDYISAPATQASLIHQPSLSADQFLSGVPQLDNLTHGFGPSRVFEISGDRGSGKTVRSRPDFHLSDGLIFLPGSRPSSCYAPPFYKP